MRLLISMVAWKASLEVGDKVPNYKIVNSFVLSYRIAQKVINDNGDNSFLGKKKGIHSNVRKDFNDTHHGISRKDGQAIASPLVINLPPVFPPRGDNG